MQNDLYAFHRMMAGPSETPTNFDDVSRSLKEFLSDDDFEIYRDDDFRRELQHLRFIFNELQTDPDNAELMTELDEIRERLPQLRRLARFHQKTPKRYHPLDSHEDDYFEDPFDGFPPYKLTHEIIETFNQIKKNHKIMASWRAKIALGHAPLSWRLPAIELQDHLDRMTKLRDADET